jgi:hypothetical protein
MYGDPFRILPRPEGQQEPDYGEELTPEKVLAANGPLHAQGPGDLTRWMAVPWQTDTASCRSGYESQNGLALPYDPYVPTFWPARVPNHVLTEEDFRIVNGGSKTNGSGAHSGTAHGSAAADAAGAASRNGASGTAPHTASAEPPPAEAASGAPDSRDAAFARRASWLRGLHGTYPDQLKQATREWHKFGIVEVREYTVGDGRFPRHIQVESKPGFDLAGVAPNRNMLTVHIPQTAVADAAALGSAVSAAADATEFDAHEITVGYIDKLDPFGEDAANGAARGGGPTP